MRNQATDYVRACRQRRVGIEDGDGGDARRIAIQETRNQSLPALRHPSRRRAVAAARIASPAGAFGMHAGAQKPLTLTITPVTQHGDA